MSVFRYLLVYLVLCTCLTAFLIFTAVFSKKIRQAHYTENDSLNSASLEKSTNLINQDLVFSSIDGKDYLIRNLLGDKIFDLEKQIYSALEDSFYQVLKAKYQNTIDSGAVIPSDEEIRRFFDDNKLQNQGTFDDFKDRIANFLAEKLTEEKLSQFVTQGINNREIVIHQKPPEKKFNFVNRGKALLGNKDAAVALIEFSDMECIFCRASQPVLNRIVADYHKEVAFYFRHFPIGSIHKNAFGAALGIECSIEQGLFEEYKKALFDDQNNLDYAGLLGKAKNLSKVDFTKFESCLNEEKYRQNVNDDLKQARQLGLNGTPTFFIGYIDNQTGNFSGDILVGKRDYGDFAAYLDKYLNKI